MVIVIPFAPLEINVEERCGGSGGNIYPETMIIY